MHSIDCVSHAVHSQVFQLVTIEDTAVKILPENLGLPRLEALTQRLESVYIDKAAPARPPPPPTSYGAPRPSAALLRPSCACYRTRGFITRPDFYVPAAEACLDGSESSSCHHSSEHVGIPCRMRAPPCCRSHGLRSSCTGRPKTRAAPCSWGFRCRVARHPEPATTPNQPHPRTRHHSEPGQGCTRRKQLNSGLGFRV